MAVDGDTAENGAFTYTGAVPCRSSGLFGYSVRVVPRHPDLPNPFESGLVTWAATDTEFRVSGLALQAAQRVTREARNDAPETPQDHRYNPGLLHG
jgi:hypothetical protein